LIVQLLSLPLQDIHGIYIDFAQSHANLQNLLQAWNLFTHISQLINHSQSSRILRASVFFTSIYQDSAVIEEMVPLDAAELYNILLTGYSLATREKRVEVANIPLWTGTIGSHEPLRSLIWTMLNI
jgi:hypothetical protein